MHKRIAACGNDCSACPRLLPKAEAQLRRTAQLWKDIGYRDSVVSAEEIACRGCTPGNWCRYGIAACADARAIEGCWACGEYPCERLEECFRTTESFRGACLKACSEAEWTALREAFFCKRENLEKLRQE